MFKRKNKVSKHLQSPGLLQVIALRMQSIQHRWADKLQIKTSHWQRKQQKRFLFIFCLVMGSYSTLSFLQVFRFASDSTTSSGISTPQSLPQLIQPHLDLPMSGATDTIVFHRFRQHLDSLVQTPEGKKQYELFLKERPDFMDSLAFAEKLIRQSFTH